uniref:Uncharacterized protein n=1 Tax=Arundo donax TaxID=35708 RepID=A0A0A9G4Z2_ARUDO
MVYGQVLITVSQLTLEQATNKSSEYGR